MTVAYGKRLRLNNSVPFASCRCWSFIGKLGGAQIISLQPPDSKSKRCFVAIGKPVHEIIHALGFFHEQSRFDRDQHVFIIKKNIIPRKWIVGWPRDISALLKLANYIAHFFCKRYTNILYHYFRLKANSFIDRRYTYLECTHMWITALFWTMSYYKM